jgi:3-oxoadipate enol-lactonase
VKLHHRLDGPGDAPPLVLSSSLGTTHALWDPQVSALAERFLLVRYDRRGHGRSPVPDGPYSLDDLGGDVLELLDELGLARVSFCGLSLGGMVGMWLAVNAPERIDRLVLCCTAAALPPPEHWHTRAAIVRRDGMAAVAEAVLARWFPHDVPASLVEQYRRQLLATPAEGYAGCCEALAGVALGGRLAEIRAPTLVLTGDADTVAPPARGDELAAGIPGASHVTLPDTGHLANTERPERFTELVLAHLTEETR